jgi:hypothetical protein
MSDRRYLHLHPTGMDASDAALTDEQIAEQGWWCKTCRRPKPGTGAIDFQILQESPVASPLCGEPAFGVSFARKDFLALLGDHLVIRDLLVGKLLGPDGSPVNGWVTVRGRHQVVIRGSKHATFRCCEACGNVLYFARPPNYLSPAPTPADAVFQSDLCGLIVPAEVVNGLNLRPKRGFGVEALPVLDAPKDGLGELLCPPSAKSDR